MTVRLQDTTTESRIRIWMVRKDLAGVPRADPPARASLTWYKSGDEADWLRIHRDACGDTVKVGPDLFDSQFGCDAIELNRRQCYIRDAAGAAMGTATAWLNSHFGDRNYARAHWIAVAPPCQGKGLAKALMSAILRKMAALGYDGAYLTTESYRHRAVRLYRSFGFVPWVTGAEDLAAWRGIQAAIGDPALVGDARGWKP